MKANELRIGNYYDHNGESKQINPSTIGEVWVAERTWCKPIPLTADWLVNLGFEHEKDNCYKIPCKIIGGYYKVYYSRINNEIHAFGVSYEDEPKEVNNFSWNIKHLHQLQNLYFALTGEELQAQAGGV